MKKQEDKTDSTHSTESKDSVVWGDGIMQRVKDKRLLWGSIVTLVVMIILTIGSMLFFDIQIKQSFQLEKADSYESYQKHYAMIVSEKDSSFWQQAYAGAKSKAVEENAYLELLGVNLNKEYAVEELMQIAIASKVDGIILEANESNAMRSLIDEAIEEGIPVITALGDNATSQRQSFVGISSFHLGREYGKQVCEIAENFFKNTWEDAIEDTIEDAGEGNDASLDSMRVMVLVDTNADDTSQNMVFSSIQEMVENSSVYHDRIVIEARAINVMGAFAAEEAIRDIFMSGEPLPDAIICLNEINTTCVYQAVVDYNKVGQIDIIGYYDSQTILNAIERNVVYGTISVDAKSLGEYCGAALNEYIETGYVSGYFSVDTTVISNENVGEYLEDGEDV